jgi:membrane protease YdiL (CAAX protease family)
VTAFAARLGRSSGLAARRDWLASAAIAASLAAIVGARWLAATHALDGLVVGLCFGTALGGLWLGATDRTGARPGSMAASALGLRAALTGLAFGIGLVIVTVIGTSIAGVSLPPGLARPAAPFVPWAIVTLVVATAEEGILRGVLFDRLRSAGGLATAVAVTTIAFALMHVPLYGWHVVPLDLAVGLGLAGLRLATGSIVAPALAHTVADLATWWL